MIDAREELADVAAQDIAIAPGDRLQAIDCAMRSFAPAVGITLGVKARLEERLDA